MASANPDSVDDEDSLSSSSSSDDEFLTLGGGSSGAGSQDREALIRKKLLESFYGKTAASDDVADDASSSSSSEGSNAADSMLESSNATKGNDDLDSPYFDADTHTSRHIMGSSVHTLLETEERMALEVRTLDSTMQTLVYENYSKFIDATDAIRSIGVSVNANEDGLARLTRGMETIDEQTRAVEENIGSLRDAVAEKLRVKRLLTRLDTLLKLPTTLKQHVSNGKYRLAAKSYLSASSILRKHSSGFESLKSIETECHVILTDMVRVLKRKVLYWSGRRDDYLGEEEDEFQNEDKTDESSSGWIPPPEPPQTVSEIFECAGTLVMVLPPDDSTGDNDHDFFDSGLSAEDCKSMALASSLRLLDRILDSHHIDIQEAKFAATSVGPTPTFEPSSLRGIGPPSPDDDLKERTRGHHLIPTTFLDSMLEAATLYGMSFSSAGDGLDIEERSRVVDFLSEAFSTFLGHVRMVLLEQSMLDETIGSDGTDDSVEQDEGEEDGAYGDVSAAMAHLLRSVRDLASGLALPEVGVDMEVASNLVDQTVELTEAMVRRRVAQEFVRLRLRVLKECLAPFVSEATAMAATDSKETETVRVVQVVQMASVALSDGMQLVDDVVRSILSGGVMVGSSATSVDSTMVKMAVESSACQFALWLASTFEILSGCENSDRRLIVEVVESVDESEARSNDDVLDENEDDTGEATEAMMGDDLSDFVEQSGGASENVSSALTEIIVEMEDKAAATELSDLILAIAEICRLAERNVMDNINQSIASCDGVGKKSKSTGIFASAGASQSQPGAIGNRTNVSERFRLAASRVLAFYAMSQGSEAASIGCCGMFNMACSEGDLIPSAPRAAIWQMLEIAKMVSIDCANVFGGERRAGPAELPEDDMRMTALKRSITGSSAIGGHLSSLQLDVERMFAEKVATYPHPGSVIDFSRNAVLTILLKVAFKAIMEVTRSCTFSTGGYRQLQVDVEFLRCMVPHFVNEDFEYEESNACNVLFNLLDDVLLNAGDRCRGVECVGVEEFFDSGLGANRTPRSIVRDFLASNEAEDGENIVSRFTISDT